ncbi:MAG TPA: hypothetical protein VI489_05035 [Candidatus Brocadiaceae bacterium]
MKYLLLILLLTGCTSVDLTGYKMVEVVECGDCSSLPDCKVAGIFPNCDVFGNLKNYNCLPDCETHYEFRRK